MPQQINLYNPALATKVDLFPGRSMLLALAGVLVVSLAAWALIALDARRAAGVRAGLALTLVKKLALQGDEVWLCFFDSRLYEGVKVGAAGHVEVPYVLQFRAERGHNYAAVIRQLNAELAAPRRGGASALVLL